MALRIQHTPDTYQWKCKVAWCPKARKWQTAAGPEHNDNFTDASVHCQQMGHAVDYHRERSMVLHP